MHFTFSEINANARYINYVESVEFVAESMMGNLCANVTMPDVLLEFYLRQIYVRYIRTSVQLQ